MFHLNALFAALQAEEATHLLGRTLGLFEVVEHFLVFVALSTVLAAEFERFKSLLQKEVDLLLLHLLLAETAVLVLI